MQKTTKQQQQEQQQAAPQTITFCSQQAISFSDGCLRNNSERYRGIAVDAEISHSFERYNIDNSSAACASYSALMSTTQTSKSEPTLAISLNARYGHRRSTIDIKQQTVMPTATLDIPYTYMMTSSAENAYSDDEDEEGEVDTFHVHDLDMLMPEPASLVSRSSPRISGAKNSTKFCNELNSYVAHDKNSRQVMHILREILSHYHHDIDFTVLHEQQQIDGVVFMCNYYAVFFCITVWSDQEADDAQAAQTETTRFEFRRKSGDCLASAKFWSEIQGLFRALDSEYVADTVLPAMDFIALELSAEDMDLDTDDDDDDEQKTTMMMMGSSPRAVFSQQELHDLTQCLSENDCFLVDELNVLYERLLSCTAIGRALLTHRPFMWQLINRCMLNADVCVMRFALLILDKLSQIDADGDTMANDSEWKLFENATALLKNERLLIQKYVVQLLAHLTKQPDWRMTQTLQHEMMQRVEKYRQRNANHLTSEINQIMDKIHTIAYV